MDNKDLGRIGSDEPTGLSSADADRAPAGLASDELQSHCAANFPGDVIQITSEEHPWYPCLLVVSELKSFGCQAFAFMPTNDGSGTGEAYIRLQAGEYERIGRAIIIPASIAPEGQP